MPSTFSDNSVSNTLEEGHGRRSEDSGYGVSGGPHLHSHHHGTTPLLRSHHHAHHVHHLHQHHTSHNNSESLHGLNASSSNNATRRLRMTESAIDPLGYDGQSRGDNNGTGQLSCKYEDSMLAVVANSPLPLEGKRNSSVETASGASLLSRKDTSHSLSGSLASEEVSLKNMLFA
ncbi:unnamed protein product [Protopolystoma xenopodis]|uniref:Uncharacterized protein n=1 Tax=Protopolystoma xenopodis TaxID=117903 RepID=A0A448WS84_9PLAT|nr:unnamed protein product [Protopolystoma xenopodis]